MNIKNCSVCKTAFYYADGEEWKTYCISCYKQKKNKEKFYQRPDSQDPNLGKERVVYRDRIVKEKIPEDILFKLIRLCHPDKHKNSESSNTITKWLLEQRGNK